MFERRRSLPVFVFGAQVLTLTLTVTLLAAAAQGAPDPEAKPVYVFRSDGSILLPNGMIRKYYESNFLDAIKLNQLVAELKTWKSEKGTFKVMPDGHTVEITERPENIPLIDRVLSMLDKPEPQVYVEAKVIEIRYDSNFEFGIDASLDKAAATDAEDTFFRSFTGVFNPPSYLDSLRPGSTDFQGGTAVFKLLGDAVSDQGALDLIVRSVQTKGTAEILSQPSLIATEKQKATIVTGEKVPIQSVETRGSTTYVKTTFEQTGIQLEITPEFIGREYVRMKVNPKVSAVREFIDGGQGTQVPVIVDRNANTTVTVRDGETLIIGGLLSTSTIEQRTQMPIVGDIPLLGWLFSSRQEVDAKSELVFFITPRIIRARTGVELQVVKPPEMRDEEDAR